MGHPDPSADPLPRSRLAAVAGAVFLANAGLLVLQLAAGRLLAPFVGSSLETWTAIIGSFLSGIALGNALGGRAADRHPTGRRLAACLALGGLAALWMASLPHVLNETGSHKALPLNVRILVLSAVLCFPAGFALSLPTPLAIRLGLPDVRRAGRVAGVVFALGTLGSLAGNYVTGFYLIPNLTVDHIVYATAAALFVTAVGVIAIIGTNGWAVSRESHPSVAAPALGRASRITVPRAALIMFLCSFAGMTLELAAARLLAQILGVSLYTWTGVIGVMLAGTALGNWLGGQLADRAADPAAAGRQLGRCLILAAVAGVAVLVVFAIGTHIEFFTSFPLVGRVLAWTFAMFFPAMFALGTVSPQAIRLAMPDVQHAGRVAGRIYAWSTTGAIAGTFATGTVLVAEFGVYRTILLAALLPGIAALLVSRVWERAGLLYVLCVAGGLAVGGFIALDPTNSGIARETNYYTIRVTDGPWLRDEASSLEAAVAVAGPAGVVDPPGSVLALQLDRLTHSRVKPTDPTYLFYPHEQIQMELLRTQAAAHPDTQFVLVIGGGGYTFPRCARTSVPTSKLDVVEIDPGVTAVSYEKLALDPKLGIQSFHLDGRQFLAERAVAEHYHLITLDAVNDLTVPYHLLTTEFNAEVKRALSPDGVYLLTVIDMLDDGRLWKAAVHTLRETFPCVQVLSAKAEPDHADKQVYVIYASAVPLDVSGLHETLRRQGVAKPYTHPLPAGQLDGLLRKHPPVVLTDQFAPVDNLMAEVFRRRKDRD